MSTTVIPPRPTPENVLPEFRAGGWKVALAPSKRAASAGAIVAVHGLSNCPWCAAPMWERAETGEAGIYIAVCAKEPSHVAEWLPWPG